MDGNPKALKTGTRDKTHLKPIGRWLQQRIIWMRGFDKGEIEQWIKDNLARNDDAEVDDVHDITTNDD
jgi:hypothetical protein